MRKLFAVAQALVLLWPSTAVSAQQTTFKSRSELVLIPVLVRDKGSAVTGLTREDFVVTDDGQPQKIANLEEVQTASTAPQHVAAPDGVYTNALAGNLGPRRITIIALDMMNTSFFD